MTNSISHTRRERAVALGRGPRHSLGWPAPRREPERSAFFERRLGRGHDQRLDGHLGLRSHGALDVLYLRSNRLRCENHHGPRGTHDILCRVSLTGGVGTQVEASSPTGTYYNLAGFSCRTIDFRLTDWLGRTVNLRGRTLSFQLIFD